MNNIIKNILLLLVGFVAVSCSETDESSKEYADWQNRNEAYFNSVYQKAKAKIAGGDANWKIITSYTLEDKAGTVPTNNIVVEVLANGSGTVSPLSTDSVRVHYDGRLMPTDTYPQGYSFQCTWTGDYNTSTMIPVKLQLGTLVDGFSTAVQEMHIGDRWRVYIPYNLGYGVSASGSIPGYSTLVFDLTLHSFSRPGKPMPEL